MTPAPGERRPIGEDKPILLILPGSRMSEVRRLINHFGDTVRLLRKRHDFFLEIPTMPHLAGAISEMTADWPVEPRILSDETSRYGAFRRAHCALAASGTVSLELAIAGVPMVIAYRLDFISRQLYRANKVVQLVNVDMFAMANIMLSEKVVPEFLQEAVAPDALCAAISPLLKDTPQRRAQTEAFGRISASLFPEDGMPPSDHAAEAIAKLLQSATTSGAS